MIDAERQADQCYVGQGRILLNVEVEYPSLGAEVGMKGSHMRVSLGLLAALLANTRQQALMTML